MSAKEWLVPLVAAAITFGGLWALQPEPAAPGAPLHYRQPFPSITVDHVGQPLTLLVLAVEPHAVGKVTTFGGENEWVTPYVALQRGAASTMTCDCIGAEPPLPAVTVASEGAPRLGLAGYNATRVTVHVFDGEGKLVLSNGNAHEIERLTTGLSPDALPAGTWYLGSNATAPNGTQKPPTYAAFLIDQIRPAIMGQPEGFVTSFQTDALATFYGRLYVTLAIDQLVFAP